MSITFNKPTECKQCGFHNFRIVGSVYNGGLNYYDLKVKCMRCGKVDAHISKKQSPQVIS